ncbi:META domain-containing protein [Rufibacter tibetensis]|uniref:DUF306 domain-containing protein n=1 Tax=Rufibacter tibetensis TaxID=512763 RepID=A0A0P0C4W7_9BACT|nr:META domain-containing protein [Rufibacter tibetensis]ALI98222.1 hypothetical protein DC20_03530 [Rufibacter tibetensis]
MKHLLSFTYLPVRVVLVLLSFISFWGCADSTDDPALSLQGSWMLSQEEPAAYNNFAAPDYGMCSDLIFTKEEDPAETGKFWGYKMNGKLPANSYSGNYQVSEEALFNQTGKLNFVNLVTTEVNATPDVRQFESYYLQALRDVDTFEVKNDVLTLSSSEKNVKLVFVRGASSCGN